MVSPEYFQTMGIALLRGRDLAWTDSRQRPVALVNRTAAQRLWPGEDPIGKRFQYVGGGPSTPTVRRDPSPGGNCQCCWRRAVRRACRPRTTAS